MNVIVKAGDQSGTCFAVRNHCQVGKPARGELSHADGREGEVKRKDLFPLLFL